MVLVMTEKVKTVIGSYFLLPDLKSRGHPIPSSLLFTSTSVICGTDPILEIDLQSGQVEPYLGPEELAKIYKEKPIEIFRIYSNGHERVLVCATHGGFIGKS